ncbi:MAG: ComEC/Rec2 family competence protein [Propionibacteriaceae bacterium]
MSESTQRNATEKSHDIRLVPVAIAAWMAMVLGTWLSPKTTILLAGIAGAIAFIMWLRKRWHVVAATAVAGACLLSAGIQTGVRERHPLYDAGKQGAIIEITGVVSGESRLLKSREGRPQQQATTITVTTTTWRGNSYIGQAEALLLSEVTNDQRLIVGEHIHVLVRAQESQAGQRQLAVLSVKGPIEKLAQPHIGLRLVERLRSGLRKSCEPLWDSARALVPALVVGDTSAMTPALTDDFQKTGMTHLTAVSGSNLALLLAFSGVVAVRLGVRGWWLRGVSVATAAGFVVLCRAEPSVIRATAMGCVAVAALGSGARDNRGIRHLSVAVVLLMLLDPWLSRNAGFALSVLASGGIILLGQPLVAAMADLPSWIAEAVAVPLAAQIATQPLVTAISGKISLVSLVTNTLAAPLVGPATLLGVIAAITAWLPAVSGAAALGAGCCTAGIVWLARKGAEFPGASWTWPTNIAALGVVTVFSLVLMWLLPRLLASIVARVIMVLLLLLGVLHVPVQPGWPGNDWAVVMCDVGQGDATVINAGDGAAVLVDVGPDPTAMEHCLSQLGITKIVMLVLSHDHSDHVGGLAAALRRPIGDVLLSRRPSLQRQQILDQLNHYGLSIHEASQGERLLAGEVQWTTIAAPPPLKLLHGSEGESSAENDGSIMAIANSKGISILLTGDAEPGEQTAVVAQQDIAVDVLKVPHHGSSHQNPDFIAATQASVAVIGVGVKNDYHHPAPRTVAQLQERGMKVARTDIHGSISIARTGHNIVVISQKSVI